MPSSSCHWVSQFIEMPVEAQENSQRKSAIHLFAFPSSVLSSFFYVFSLFFFCSFWPANPFGQGVMLARASPVCCWNPHRHSYLWALWVWALLRLLLLFQCCMQCTCQSLIEGKIAGWLAFYLALTFFTYTYMPVCVCLCVNAAYFPDDLAEVTATSLLRCLNKVKTKERKLFMLCEHWAKSLLKLTNINCQQRTMIIIMF